MAKEYTDVLGVEPSLSEIFFEEYDAEMEFEAYVEAIDAEMENQDVWDFL